MKYLLGFDVGTTAMKGMLINENGETVCLVNENYDLLARDKYEAEIDPQVYWESFKAALKAILNISGVNPEDIASLAIDSQGETLICLDDRGQPIRRAIVWLDNRSTAEADEIKSEFGLKKTYDITGQPDIVATWTATKILWIRKNEEDIFNQVAKYLLVSDYLNFKLTGRYYTDRSVSSSTLYYDIHLDSWWEEMLDYIGITGNQLPELKSSGSIIGNISKEAERETGLSKNTVVVMGALDQMAACIGAGNILPEVVSESTGTVLAMCVTSDHPIPYNEDYRIPCHCHAIPEKYSQLYWSQTAGAILEWYKDNFIIHDASYNGEIYKRIDEEAEKINPGSDGLIVLPHFSGTAVPHFNPKAKGVFFGVTLDHTKAHFSRAIMEAIGFMLKEHIEIAESYGIEIKEIRSLGGGANSSLWNQIKADITGKEIITLENTETASLGSAILAGIGSSVFKDFEDAFSRCIKPKKRYQPNKKNTSIYEGLYEQYKNLYMRVDDLF